MNYYTNEQSNLNNSRTQRVFNHHWNVSGAGIWLAGQQFESIEFILVYLKLRKCADVCLILYCRL